MFWKKKKIATDSISLESDDTRQAYRYIFKKDQRFQIEFKGEKVWVVNISAGGLAFENKDFKELDFDFIKFTLKIPNYKGNSEFYAGLRILEISSENICHCIFEECSLDQHELIHKYVLEMQKNDLTY